MSAFEQWCALPFHARRKITDALDDWSVRAAIAAVLDPPNSSNEMNGPEMTHDEDRDLATAIAALTEVHQ